MRVRVPVPCLFKASNAAPPLAIVPAKVWVPVVLICSERSLMAAPLVIVPDPARPVATKSPVVTSLFPVLRLICSVAPLLTVRVPPMLLAAPKVPMLVATSVPPEIVRPMLPADLISPTVRMRPTPPIDTVRSPFPRVTVPVPMSRLLLPVNVTSAFHVCSLLAVAATAPPLVLSRVPPLITSAPGPAPNAEGPLKLRVPAFKVKFPVKVFAPVRVKAPTPFLFTLPLPVMGLA